MHTNYRGSQEWKDENLPLTTGSNEACKLYDAALSQFTGWYNDESLGGIGGTLEKLKKADENFVMGMVVANGLELMGASQPLSANKALVDDMTRMKELGKTTPNLTWREKKHVEALDYFGQGFLDKAADSWQDILLEYPTDVLALKYVHNAYFFQGNISETRDNIARVLPYWKPTQPLYGYILGMHSYGLEQTNLYQEAEQTARNALSINPRDAWATHTLCHVMEMQGRQEEGIHMLESTLQYWESCSMLACHNHWHWALYYLELGDFETALTLLDKEISTRAFKSKALFGLVDVASLLFRLQMEGVNVGNRWTKLFELMKDHLHDHVVMFHDIFILISCLGANRKEATQELMDSIEKFVREGQGTTKDVMARVGEKLMKSFMAYNDEDYASAVDLLAPIRHDVVTIGGSHAQRDIFNIFLIQAAIKSPLKKHHQFARHLLNERKLLKPKSPLTDRLIAKAIEEHAD